MKLKLYIIVSITTVLLWTLVGVITLLSIYNGISNYLINGIIGVLFVCIGLFFYAKYKNSIRIISLIKETDVADKRMYDSFINIESVLMILGFFISLVFLSAIIPRVFIERFPVFG